MERIRLERERFEGIVCKERDVMEGELREYVRGERIMGLMWEMGERNVGM